MNWLATGAVGMALAVSLGAFGAHALRARFDAYATGIWDKAVFYHFVHALALVIIGGLARGGILPSAGANRVCWLLAAGVLIFSGSLYALALTGVRTLGAITPIGGTAFIAGWLLLAWVCARG